MCPHGFFFSLSTTIFFQLFPMRSGCIPPHVAPKRKNAASSICRFCRPEHFEFKISEFFRKAPLSTLVAWNGAAITRCLKCVLTCFKISSWKQNQHAMWKHFFFFDEVLRWSAPQRLANARKKCYMETPLLNSSCLFAANMVFDCASFHTPVHFPILSLA